MYIGHDYDDLFEKNEELSIGFPCDCMVLWPRYFRIDTIYVILKDRKENWDRSASGSGNKIQRNMEWRTKFKSNKKMGIRCEPKSCLVVN